MKYFRRVLPYLYPYWPLAACSVVLIFVGAITSLLMPWPLKILIDNVLSNEPLPGVLENVFGAMEQIPLLYTAVLALFLITVAVHGVSVIDRYVNTKLEQRMALDFRSDLFEHTQKLSMAYHDQRRSGHLIFIINSQGESVSSLIMTVPPVGQSIISLVGMVLICWSIDTQLTMIALTIGPLLYISTSYYMKHVHARIMQVRMMEGEALSIVHEAVSMMRVIVAFGRERFEQRRFLDQGERAIDARVRLTVRQSLFSLTVAVIIGAGTSLVLGLGFARAIQGFITIGELLVVITYIAMIYQPMSTISSTVGSLQEVFVNLQIAFELLDTEPDVKDAPDAFVIDRCEGRIEFKDVRFSYQGRQETLEAVTFKAEPGQVVAIVGHTGAGKTTLLSLIPRFYDPMGGGVFLDGRDVRTVTVRSLRDQLSLVLQEPLLFSGTILDNIRYSRPDSSMDEVIEAAKAANAHDFISALPDGYETLLGERGARLSGGERQRISVARAFIKNAPILLLDEPTSSIDLKTEDVILDALDRLMVGRTTFIIAHRLSTIRRADTVLVLGQGRILEQGPPSELLSRDGPYRRLYEYQLTGRSDDEPEEAE